MKWLLLLGASFIYLDLSVKLINFFNPIPGLFYQTKFAVRSTDLSDGYTRLFSSCQNQRRSQSPVREPGLSDEKNKKLGEMQVKDEYESQQESARKQGENKQRNKPGTGAVYKEEIPASKSPKPARDDPPVQTTPAQSMAAPSTEAPTTSPVVQANPSEINSGYLLALSIFVLVGLLALFLMGKKIYGVLRNR